MIVLPSGKFRKSFKSLQKKVKAAFEERLKLFKVNKFHPLLNNHKLNPPYEGSRSFDVTGDIRVIFEERQEEFVVLLDVGPHNKLYKS